MKRVSLFVVAIIIACTSSALPADEKDWRLVKHKDGIDVFVKNVPGSAMRQYRGVMRMQGVRLANFVAVMDDAPSYPRWMHSCAEARVVRIVNRLERYTYVRTAAPWPVSDRDIVYYSVVRQDPKTLAVTIIATGVPDAVPQVKGVVRLPKATAIWTFTPAVDGSVVVELIQHAEPGGSVPTSLVSLAEVDIPFYTLLKMRAVVRESRYSQASYPEIKEPR